MATASPAGNRGQDTPAGYRRVAATPGTAAVAREQDARVIAAILARTTLYDWAARHPERRGMQGRGVAWAVPLDSGTRVVVRHSRHGGMLAPVTGDRFLAPTRAPHELDTSLRLIARGVPTPAVVAYATYSAGPGLRRADVAVEEVDHARDLGDVVLEGGNALDAALHATGLLLHVMARAGAHHPDLNVKNVLLSSGPGMPTAWVLDVDRIRFTDPARARRGNAARLARSLRKWRDTRAAQITDAQIARVTAHTGD